MNFTFLTLLSTLLSCEATSLRTRDLVTRYSASPNTNGGSGRLAPNTNEGSGRLAVKSRSEGEGPQLTTRIASNFLSASTKGTLSTYPTPLVSGTDDAQYAGMSVSYAGDVNGDGIDDVIVGSPGKSLTDSIAYVGAAFVIFGQEGTLPDISAIATLDGTNGFALFGHIINDDVGYSVSYAGDINGDGLADVIIGAPGVDAFYMGDSGQAYVIFGSQDPFPPMIETYDLDGSNGFIIQGDFSQDELGASVSSAGDVNGDGIDDVLVGAPRVDNLNGFDGGEAYVIYGSTSRFSSLLHVKNLNGRNGFTIQSQSARDSLGVAVSSAGDIDGDGYSDILVGAIGAKDGNNIETGAVYVIYGRANFPTRIQAGFFGYTIFGTSEYDQFGFALSAVGDVNGDSIDDFVVGCPRCRPHPGGGDFYSGGAYVFYGGAQPSAAEDADIMVAGLDSFDGVGYSVSGGGDINGDGLDDVVIAAGKDGSIAVVSVLYGSSTVNQKYLRIAEIKGSIGMTIPMFPSNFDGTTNRQISVSDAGDFNHDGLPDIIVGLPEVKMADGTMEGHIKVLLGQAI